MTNLRLCLEKEKILRSKEMKNKRNMMRYKFREK